MAIVINGSGTVAGLAVGGLPDDTVDAGSLANSINSEITANTAKTGITSAQATAITAALPKAGGTTTGSNMLYIARDASERGNNACWIKGETNGAVYQGNNSTAWSQVSDERIKKNIVNSSNGLAKIDALQVRNFNYKTQEEITVDGLIGCNAVGLQTGVIAQEIETVLPNAVSADSAGCKQVNTDPVFWAMVKAIQELSAKVTALENE